MKGKKSRDGRRQVRISVRLLTTPILLALPDATNIYYSETPRTSVGVVQITSPNCTHKYENMLTPWAPVGAKNQ